jgi:hypothetical protein
MFGSDIQYSTYLTIIGIISRSEMDHLVERQTTAPMAERPVALPPVFARRAWGLRPETVATLTTRQQIG